jgi:hypothetical protein
MLISETHFTEKKNYLKYTVYQTNHLAGTAGSGTAIIIKKSIKHHQLNNYSHDFLQETSVGGRLSRSLNNFGVYLPPKYIGKRDKLEYFDNTLEHRFIAGIQETTMLSIPTGDPDSSLPEEAKYSKRWKETT